MTPNKTMLINYGKYDTNTNVDNVPQMLTNYIHMKKKHREKGKGNIQLRKKHRSPAHWYFVISNAMLFSSRQTHSDSSRYKI